MTSDQVRKEVVGTCRDLTPFETLLCAQVNFQNLEIVAPDVTQLPIYTIAKMQLDEAIRAMAEQQQRVTT